MYLFWPVALKRETWAITLTPDEVSVLMEARRRMEGSNVSAAETAFHHQVYFYWKTQQCLDLLIYFIWRIITMLWWFLLYINMNQSVWIGHRHTYVPSILNPLPAPSPSHPSRLSQSTGFGCPILYIKLPLVICFAYGNVYVSTLFSKIIPSFPLPTESKSLFFMSASPLLPCAFESVLMGWMNLEPLIQNEVSQKKKGKYHILTSGFCIMERCLGGLREDLELVVKVRTGEVWAEGVDEGENIWWKNRWGGQGWVQEEPRRPLGSEWGNSLWARGMNLTRAPLKSSLKDLRGLWAPQTDVKCHMHV